MKNQLTCKNCPKFREDIGVCLHMASATPAFHPILKYGKQFIADENPRLARVESKQWEVSK